MNAQIDFFESAPTLAIMDAIPRTERAIRQHARVVCSISGGADSDIMMDMVHRLDPERKVRYVFFDTGVEMEATKRHLLHLEEKYGVNIEIIRPLQPVAYAVRKYGYPFLDKTTSEYIYRLQKHNFKWEDRPFEELYKEYPNCKAALRWWCNAWKEGPHEPMQTEIGSKPFLKEFIIENPPSIPISKKCCDCAKKKPAAAIAKEADLQLVGIRKAEGGARAMAYKSCFIDGRCGKKHFPLFWWLASDKLAYEQTYGVTHSDAYTVYGCSRTGCAGCPFGSGFEDELQMLDQNEPKLAAAVRRIFEPSYSYTRAYRIFRDEQRALARACAAPEISE